MHGDSWPTATELTHLAFDAANQTDFRREVMRRLMRSTGSDMAIFADATTPLTPSHVFHLDPGKAEAARLTVLSHPDELRRADQQLRRCGVMVDTLLYSQREWERLPHVAEHQIEMGIRSNIVMSWMPRCGAPIVVNLCLAQGHYSVEQERTARRIVKPLAVADAWFSDSRIGAEPTAPELTPRQREILGYLRRGLTNPEIAKACHLSRFTVRNHLVKLFERYDVTTRTELALLAPSLDESDDTPTALRTRWRQRFISRLDAF